MLYIWNGKHWGLSEKVSVSYCSHYSARNSKIWRASSMLSLLRTRCRSVLNRSMGSQISKPFTERECLRSSPVCAPTSLTPLYSPPACCCSHNPICSLKGERRSSSAHTWTPCEDNRIYMCIQKDKPAFYLTITLTSLIFPEIEFYDHFPTVLWLCMVGLSLLFDWDPRET